MSRIILLMCLFVCGGSALFENSLVQFPYAREPCSCVVMTCTCCAGIEVKRAGFSKHVCITVSVGYFSPSIELTIYLDDKQLGQFGFSAKNPPTYCIPIILPVNVSMCLKVHDVKLAGLLGLQICMTLYSTFNDKNVFVIPLNCLRVSARSLKHFTTNTAAP